jgi:hypothetical protein
MMIGIDFDNTIVSYDVLFHIVAVERCLVPAEFPQSKEQIRNHLRCIGREDDWTLLQGEVYGNRMSGARPFSGVKEFIAEARMRNIPLAIISHKTETPYLGPPYDLHDAARKWLYSEGIIGEHGIQEEYLFFEVTKEAKLRRIHEVGCSVFIDDLPELLSDPLFPAGVEKILFSPSSLQAGPKDGKVFRSWAELQKGVLR